MPFFNTVPGLVPLKIYSGNTLLTTNVNLINFTGSGVTTTVNAFNGLTVNIGGGGGTIDTGSLLITASFSNPNLTFTKGNGSTFNVNLINLVPNTASYALTASYANEISGGAPNYVVLWKTSTSLTSSAFYQTGSFMGLGTTTPKVKFHVKDNNFGTMGLPYETAVFETNGDTKLGVYNSNTSSFTSQGASLTLGYTSITNSLGYYPGFEIQELGNTTWYENYLRFNSIHRNSSGVVLQAIQGIINVFADGRVSINPVVTGLTATSSFLIGTSTYGGFRFDSSGSSRFQTGLTVTGSLNAPIITGSLFGTSSWAISSSQAISSSYALSASFAPAGNPFPFSGSAQITGSLGVTGSVSLRSGSNLTVNNGLIISSFNTSNLSVGGTPGWTSGVRNTNFGLLSQTSVTTQTDNTSVGYSSLLGGGSFNVAIGSYASQLNSGNSNTAIGYYALGNKTSDIAGNVAIGYQAMYNASGSGAQFNIAIGHSSLYNSIGSGNVAIGQTSLYTNTNGFRNIAIGTSTLNSNTTGFNNVSVGYTALQNNVDGYSNVAIGAGAMSNKSTGDLNVAIGTEAMLYMATGSDNIAIGREAMRGSALYTNNRFSNIALGVNALRDSIFSNTNIAIGGRALSNAGNTTASVSLNGSYNIGIGPDAGRVIYSGIENIVIGYLAGTAQNNNYNSQSSGSYNIFIGSSAGSTFSTSNRTINDYNILIGYYSGWNLNNNGPYNVSLGDYTHANLSSSTAVRNTSIGSQAGANIRSGFRNTSLGAQAGYNINTGSYNIFIGDSAGYDIVSGSNNTIIGSVASLSASLNNTLIIGTGTTQRILINSVGSGSFTGSLTVTGPLTTNNSFLYTSSAFQTTLDTTGFKLTNVASGSQSASIQVSGNGTVGGASYIDFIRVTNTSASAANPNKTFRVSGTGDWEVINSAYTTNIFTLTDAGVLSTPGGGTSDRRTKDNINYITESATYTINQLQPAEFEFKNNLGVKRHGFIAQDVLEIKPDLVLGDGYKENGTYGLDYDGILALTVKALQEANTRIDKLEKTIEKLKNK
jgi:hypothetical protein